jgi:tRNA U34 2-thiouridine synthase MnmA/TrmU
VDKDLKKNILYVSQAKEKNPKIRGVVGSLDSSLRGRRRGNFGDFFLSLQNPNWINEIELNKNYTAQIRYHGELLPCTVQSLGKDTAQISFKKPVLVASGQSCVLYDGDVCLGGGVVS